jgi:hypothetical protein
LLELPQRSISQSAAPRKPGRPISPEPGHWLARVATYGIKYEKTAECLKKGRGPLLAFCDFPAEHWKHLRTSDEIESTFATVRHRTTRSKVCLSNRTALAMVFKLVEAAKKTWRRLHGHNQLPKIIRGVSLRTGARSSPSRATFNPKPPPPDPSAITKNRR